MKRPKTLPAALALAALGACATPGETARLRQEITELQGRLAHEKQRQAEYEARIRRARAPATGEAR